MKPAAGIATIRSGIPTKHSPFWSRMSVSDLHAVYSALALSPARVLAMIEEPACVTPNQERVVAYLRQFIGSMHQDKIRAFVRFVTGASVCLAPSIQLTFNTLDGFAMRPISHSCSSTLEIPVSNTFPEFVSEFRSILSDTNSNYTWIMAAI